MEEQYTQLYKNGFQRTCSIFHKLGFSPEDSQDLAQEVYLELWRDAKARSRAQNLLNLWFLKVGLILQRAKQGRYSSPMDVLISVRNIEEHPHLGGSTAPLDQSEEVVFDDFLRGLPVPVAREVAGLLEGMTYAERRQVSKLHPTSYVKLREQLMTDPNIQAYIQKFLRS